MSRQAYALSSQEILLNMRFVTGEAKIRSELERIYSSRFSGQERYRNEVWKVLTSDFFSKWISPESTVLDLGCGYGEFINNIPARRRFAMDLNPTARDLVGPTVELIQQDCSEPWPLEDNSLDVVFSSNFFEHLPTKAALQATLVEVERCLRPGGLIMAMGPNVRFLSGSYWDFFDHHLALTERALSEAMLMARLTVEQAIAKFLPYTMSQGFQPPPWTVGLYLKLPLLWRIFGKQFLVIARKQSLP